MNDACALEDPKHTEGQQNQPGNPASPHRCTSGHPSCQDIHVAWPVGTYGQKGGKDCPTALAALVVAASLLALKSPG